jgi:DNA-binding CsgD family transcriptional regulator
MAKQKQAAQPKIRRRARATPPGVDGGSSGLRIPSAGVLPDALRSFFDDIAASRPIHVLQRVRYPDGRLRYTYASPRIIEMIGKDAKRILEQDNVDHHWIHPEDREAFVAALHISASQLTVFDQEARITNSEGQTVWLRSIGHPRLMADGAVVWDGIAIDVTDHHLAMRAIDTAVNRARGSEGALVDAFVRVGGQLLGQVRQLRDLATKSGDMSGRGFAAAMATAMRGVETVELSMETLLREAAASRQPAPVMPGVTVRALTSRQVEILRLIAQGHANREIANRLSITEGTVKVHISALLKRLGVSSRMQAARLVDMPNGI